MADKNGQNRGGARTGAGKKSWSELDKPHADRSFAAKLIASLSHFNAPKDEPEDIAQWRLLWWSTEQRIQLDTRRYWYDKRDGKAAQAVNVNANVTIDATRREHIRDLIARLAGKPKQ